MMEEGCRALQVAEDSKDLWKLRSKQRMEWLEGSLCPHRQHGSCFWPLLSSSTISFRFII